MRVALDTGPLLGQRTGIGVTVAALVEAFSALEEPPEISPYAISFRGDIPDGTRRLPLPATVAHRIWSRASLPRMDHWLGDVDVVHGTNHVVPPSRHPRLVSVYDAWFLAHPEGVHADVRRAAAVLRRSVREGAVVHTCSHASADALRDLLGRERRDLRIEVVHLGTLPVGQVVDATTAAVPELAGRPWILAVGTREKRKNLSTLIRAFGAAMDSLGEIDGAGWRLVLAGGAGNDDPAIEAALAELRPSRAAQVLLLGRVDDDRKAWLLRGATALAYPSLDEGFGLPLLEAMDAGIPVVASTAGSIPEVAGDAALLVAPTDVDALAHALVTVATDDTERRRLTTSGHARARHFDWADTARAMTDLYSALAMDGTTR